VGAKKSIHSPGDRDRLAQETAGNGRIQQEERGDVLARCGQAARHLERDETVEGIAEQGVGFLIRERGPTPGRSSREGKDMGRTIRARRRFWRPSMSTSAQRLDCDCAARCA